MTEKSMVEPAGGAHFGSEMSALANGWKRLFKGEKDPHFIYTIPAKGLAPKITQPDAIKGESSGFVVSAWPEQGGKHNSYQPGAYKAMEGLVDAVIKAAY